MNGMNINLKNHILSLMGKNFMIYTFKYLSTDCNNLLSQFYFLSLQMLQFMLVCKEIYHV